MASVAAVAAAAAAQNSATPVAGNTVTNGSPNVTPAAVTKSASRRSWHEYGRNSDIDKIQIPKL